MMVSANGGVANGSDWQTETEEWTAAGNPSLTVEDAGVQFVD